MTWGELGHSQTLRVLHNPRYTGAFVFGRSQTRRKLDGGHTIKWLPREEWGIVIRDAHPGYLSWEEYETNLQRLRAGAQAKGAERRRSPAREGPALLQGLVICGRCGNRMTVRYHIRRSHLEPNYVCQRFGVEHAEPICQTVPGAGIDQAVGELLVEVVSPLALEVALSVQQELQSRAEEIDRLRRAQVERTRYEAQLAERCYRHVDPANRLVADALEADWDQKLRALAEAQQDYERQRQADRSLLSEEERARILTLATDFPRLWRDARTPDRERKRMVRLLLEDVTVLRDHREITLHLRFKGGAHKPCPCRSHPMLGNSVLPAPRW